MDWTKLYNLVHDAVIDHEHSFGDFVREEIHTVAETSKKILHTLDCLICPDSVWFAED